MVTTTTVGSMATYTCNTGYRIEGVSQRECLVNGTWSQDPPTCISKLTKGSKHNMCAHYYNYHTVIDCGDPGTPDNGDTMQTTTTFGSIVNHTCDVGYSLNGTSQRECLADETWSEPLPICVSKFGCIYSNSNDFYLPCLILQLLIVVMLVLLIMETQCKQLLLLGQ